MAGAAFKNSSRAGKKTSAVVALCERHLRAYLKDRKYSRRYKYMKLISHPQFLLS
jgi:hypothetical protein